MGPFVGAADAMNIEDDVGKAARLTKGGHLGISPFTNMRGSARGLAGANNTDMGVGGVRQTATGSSFHSHGSFHSETSNRSNVTRVVSLDDPVSLRGINLDKILACCGGILRQHADPDSAWECSQVVWEDSHQQQGGQVSGTRRKPCPLRGFISHSWRATRASKYLALVIHYQLKLGLIIPFLLSCIFGYLADEGLLTFHINEVANGILYGPECLPQNMTAMTAMADKCQVGSIMTFGGVPLCLFIVFFRSDITNLFRPCRQRDELNPMFLEVACCRQDSTAFRSNYFSNLPAFLFKSKALVVILDEDYLQSASSVMELMMFLVVQPRGPVAVLMTQTPKLIVSGIIILFIATIIPRGVLSAVFVLDVDLPGRESDWVVGSFALQIAITGAFFGYFTNQLHICARQRWTQNDDMMKKFRIQDIYREDDQSIEVMEETIVNVLYDFGFVSDSQDVDKALQVFNRLVRDHASLTFEINLPRNGVHYWEVLAMLQTTWWVDMDRLYGILVEDTSEIHAVSYILVMSMLFFAVNPLLMAALSWYVRRGNLSDDTPWIWLWCVGIMMNVVYFGVEWVFLYFRYRAVMDEEEFGWWIVAAMTGVFAILCYFTRQAYKSQLPPQPKMKKDKS